MEESQDDESDENDEEKYLACPTGLPVKDLEIYADLVFDLEIGNSIQENVKCLAKYGASLKEIDLWFKNHLESCYTCKELYSERLATYDWASSREFLEATGIPPSKLTFRDNLEKLLKQFGIEHFEMEDEAIKLRDYILDKYRCNEPPQENLAYEEHIKACVLCRNIDFSAKNAFASD